MKLLHRNMNSLKGVLSIKYRSSDHNNKKKYKRMDEDVV